MAFQAGAIVSELTLNRSKFSASMKQVSKEVKGLGGLVQRNSAQVKRMGRTMVMAGTAITATIGAMVKAYGNFDEAMVKSLAIMGDVSPAMRKQMAETAKELSTKSTFAAKELAESYYFLASAGMNAEQSISALAPVSRFAQAGTFDLALATDLLTDAQTALGLSSKNVIENEKQLIRVSDVLVGANTLANASVLQFSEALTNKAAAALVNVNKEVEEGVAVLAAYADKGVKGRLAGQRLTMMLNGLFDAARNNRKAWDGIGISLFNADESMRDISSIIADLEVHLGAMTVKQREAELAALGFNIKTKDSILTLMGSSEKIKEWTEKLKGMQGITKEVADKQLKAFNAQMKLLKNTIIKAVMPIGKSLVPTLESLAEKIKGVAEKIERWVEKHPRLTAFIVKLVAAVGALLIPMGALMMMLPGIIAALPALKAALASLLGPLGLIIVAATAVGFALNKLIENYKDKQDAEIMAIMKGTNTLAKFIALRKKLIKDEVVTVDEWSEIYNRHGRSYKRVLHAIATLPEYAHIKAAWDELIEKHEDVEKSLKDVPPVPKALTQVQSMWTGIANIFNKVSIRVGEMQGKIKNTSFVVGNVFGDLEKGFVNINVAAVKAAKLPPLAVNIPKMSLKDLRDYYIKWLADLKTSWASAWQAALSGSRNVVSAMDAVFSQFATNQSVRLEDEEKQRTDVIEAWFENQKERIERTITDEETLVAALEALDEEKARKENELQHKMDKERRKLERAKAKGEKMSALFSAGINVAEAITKAFTSGPLIGQILAGIVAALGAVQMAAIAAAPLPALQHGGAIGTAGIVGEAGPELFFPRTPGTIVPLRTEASAMAGNSIYFTVVGPLIKTTGLARADLEKASSMLLDIIKGQLRRGDNLNA